MDSVIEQKERVSFDPVKAAEAVEFLVKGEIFESKSKWWIVEGVPEEKAKELGEAAKELLNGDEKVFTGPFAALSGKDLLDESRAKPKDDSWESFKLDDKLYKRKHLIIDASGLGSDEFWKLVSRFAGRTGDHSIFLCKEYPRMPDSLPGTVTKQEMASLKEAGNVFSLHPKDYELIELGKGEDISWPEDLKVEEEVKQKTSDELKKVEKERLEKETKETGLQVINDITKEIIDCLSGGNKDRQRIKKLFRLWERKIDNIPELRGQSIECFIGAISEVNAYIYLCWLKNKEYLEGHLIKCDRIVKATVEEDKKGVDLQVIKEGKIVPVQVKTLKRNEGEGLIEVGRGGKIVVMRMGLKEDTTGLKEGPVVVDRGGKIIIKEDERSLAEKLSDLIWIDADCRKATGLREGMIDDQPASLIRIINGY